MKQYEYPEDLLHVLRQADLKTAPWYIVGCSDVSCPSTCSRCVMMVFKYTAEEHTQEEVAIAGVFRRIITGEVEVDDVQNT